MKYKVKEDVSQYGPQDSSGMKMGKVVISKGTEIELEPIEEEKEEKFTKVCKECGSKLGEITFKEEPSPWPQEGDKYYFIGRLDVPKRGYSMAMIGRYRNSTEDLDNVATGNVYKTLEETKQALERQKAIVRVNKRISELNLMSSRNDYVRLFFNDKYERFSTVSHRLTMVYADVIKPVASDFANQIISEMEDDLKLIFNIE